MCGAGYKQYFFIKTFWVGFSPFWERSKLGFRTTNKCWPTRMLGSQHRDQRWKSMRSGSAVVLRDQRSKCTIFVGSNSRVLNFPYICLSIFSRQPLSRELLREKIPRSVWKIQITTGRFLAQLHRSNFVLKILFLVPKVSNSWIFQKRSFMKISWHRISIQHCYSKMCLPTRQNGFQNRNKVYESQWNQLSNTAGQERDAVT